MLRKWVCRFLYEVNILTDVFQLPIVNCFPNIAFNAETPCGCKTMGRPYRKVVFAGWLGWNDLGKTEGLDKVYKTEIILKPIDDARINAYREQFSGSQKERKEKTETGSANNAANQKGKNEKQQPQKKEKKEEVKKEPLSPDQQIALFNEKIALKVAKIIEIQRHPDAEKLYIEKLDDGSGQERVICSDCFLHSIWIWTEIRNTCAVLRFTTAFCLQTGGLYLSLMSGIAAEIILFHPNVKKVDTPKRFSLIFLPTKTLFSSCTRTESRLRTQYSLNWRTKRLAFQGQSRSFFLRQKEHTEKSGRT